MYHRGQVQYQKGQHNKEASTVQRSYCFDYQKLVETNNINFEKASDTDGDTAHMEDYNDEHPKQQELQL